MRNIMFFGDRNSKTIKIGKFLQKYFSRIKIRLFDGYKSKIYIDNK